jgi:kinesin family protein 15
MYGNVFQVKQREDEAECNKQVLRFQEDKIRRLEMLSAGLLSADTFYNEDANASLQESQLIQDHKGGDSKLTNFALENIQLQEQLCRYLPVLVWYM